MLHFSRGIEDMPAIQVEREIYIQAARSYDLLQKSIKLFEEYLEKKLRPNDPQYYRARNFLKEGKTAYEETLKRAKTLLGPIPSYAPRDYEQQRTKVLVENKIVVLGQSVGEIAAEMTADDLLTTMMTGEEISAYLNDHLEAQRSGKRKLANIKFRMVLDKLNALIVKGTELQKLAQKQSETAP
jgi:hypothetical protein